jgi:thiamine pyrophosphate-dependent acetolactate synthase large subunit-like protein
MQRYDYLKAIAADAGDALAVCTGWGAREWWALRPSEGNLKTRTLGLVSSIATGLALALPHRKVLALDGDGAFLMNLCGLPTIARQNPGNLIHLLFDNEIYEASGGTATASAYTDAAAIAKGAGYRNALWVESPEQFRAEFLRAWWENQLTLIAVKVAPGQPNNLPPLRLDEIENKYRFIRYLENTEHKEILNLGFDSKLKSS